MRLSFYRLLLRLYPASFRSEYGAEMLAIFAATTAAAGGWMSRLGVALRAAGRARLPVRVVGEGRRRRFAGMTEVKLLEIFE